MNKIIGTISLLAALLVTSCASTSHRFGITYPARPRDHPIIIVEADAQLPLASGPWTKIGEATVTDNGWGADVTKMLVEKARQLGGDALVRLQKYKTTQTFGIGWKDMASAEIWRKDRKAMELPQDPP